MRDAIVYSGSGWEGCNVMERLAVALSILGARVLYCENPASRLKGKAAGIEEIEPGIYRFRSTIFGHRLNEIRPLALLQSRGVAKQIAGAAEATRLRDPIFFYSYSGRLLPMCKEMKRRGYFLVHVCMDYPELNMREHVELADLTLTIPRAALDPIREMSGGRAERIPQLGPPRKKGVDSTGAKAEPAALASIPRPRLIYAGALQNRVLLPVVREILESKPEWHFLHFGSVQGLPEGNAHRLPWMSIAELERVIAACDVGFMPYDLNDPVQYNVAPLKLIDYFDAGLPVVATPIADMKELEDLVYLGTTAEELTNALERALGEPADSPKRARRKEIAREHSLENIAALLGKILPLEG